MQKWCGERAGRSGHHYRFAERPDRLLMEQLHYNLFRWFGGPRMDQVAIGSFGCRRLAITYNLIGMAILIPAPFVCA